jgi:hypothetical protein
MSKVKMLGVAKQWHAEIADLRHKDHVIVDNLLLCVTMLGKILQLERR